MDVANSAVNVGCSARISFAQPACLAAQSATMASELYVGSSHPSTSIFEALSVFLPNDRLLVTLLSLY